MRAARKSAVAIIAGLATTISVIGTAGSAMAAETRAPSETAAKTASVGTAIKDPSVKVRQVKQVTQPKYTASKGGVSAASTPTCYTYSNGRGDLCQWYLPNYGQSRGGFYNASTDLRYNYFLTSGWGQNSWMSNKAESAYNYGYYYRYAVFTGPNYTGDWGGINPRSGVNYNQTYKNDVES